MPEETLESRVARLEQQLALIVGGQRDFGQPGPDEWKQTVGMFRGDPVALEMIELAQKTRDEERRLAREQHDADAP
jgi:hypothetical protein